MTDRLPANLRRRAADERGRPVCDCGGRYAQHNLLTGKCYCADGCTCARYTGVPLSTPYRFRDGFDCFDDAVEPRRRADMGARQPSEWPEVGEL